MGARNKQEMKKVLLNSDMINDEEHIYFSLKDNYFEFYQFLLSDDLVLSIYKCIENIQETYAGTPVAMFIPFVPYNNFVVSKSNDEILDMKNLGDMIGCDLEIHIMIPDRLKDRIATM